MELKKKDFLTRGTSNFSEKTYVFICERASKDDKMFQKFRSHEYFVPVIDNATPQQGQAFLDEILRSSLKDIYLPLMSKFCEADLYGSPSLAYYETLKMSISPNTLRNIRFVCDLETHFGTALENMKIVQIGANGYGGICRALTTRFPKRQQFTIIDIDPVAKLTKKYLGHWKDTEDVNILSTLQIQAIEELKNVDLVISNFKFSESSHDVREFYFDCLLKDCPNGYFIINAFNPEESRSFQEKLGNKNVSTLPEIPQTGPRNYVMVWKQEQKNEKVQLSNTEPINIACDLFGRLGNQLFQVATGLSLMYELQQTHPFRQVKFFLNHTDPSNPYVSTIFQNLPRIHQSDTYVTYNEKRYEHDEIPLLANNILLHGYFQSYKYFLKHNDKVVNGFRTVLQKICSSVETSDDYKTVLNTTRYKKVVALHVRRGDYVNLGNYHHNLTLNYYKKAIARIGDLSQTHFFIFSDDIEWCQQQSFLATLASKTFIGRFLKSQERSLAVVEDLLQIYVMSQCHVFIIANSSFSWWGAHLSDHKDKIIFYPKNWWGPLNKHLSIIDLIPHNDRHRYKGLLDNENSIEKLIGVKIDGAICISVENQLYRQMMLEEECDQYGIPFEFLKVQRHPVSGERGCLESHLQCIRMAKERQYKTVFIMEDDALFTIHSSLQNKSLSFPKPWDTIFIGYHAREGYLISDHILKLTQAFALHAYVTNESMYDYILNNVKSNMIIDVFWSDWICKRRQQSYGVYPLAATQRPSPSLITGQYQDYRDLLQRQSELVAQHRKYVSLRRHLDKYPNEYFVETGTFEGEGIMDALTCGFQHIVSIEISETLVHRAREKFKMFPQVVIKQGSSACDLWDIIKDINKPITFWLDAHYSQGSTSFDKNCVSPLLKELDQIQQHPIKTHTILIDDRRLFKKSTNQGMDTCFDVEEEHILQKLKGINPNYLFKYEHGHVENDILVAVIDS